MLVSPEDVRQPGWIKFQDIPVNQYQKSVEDEKDRYSKEDFLRIYRYMRLIREFETMLYSIKTTNTYNGLEYNNPGPAHLSLGQEAAAVGQAYLLTPDDYIFGSHRSHGEILAKGLSAIHQMKEEDLLAVMENFLDGAAYKVVEKANQGRDLSVLAAGGRVLVYGVLAEIFAKETGFHKGLGGSMHAFSCRSAFIPTMPSWAVPVTSRWVRRSIRKSIANPAS